MSVVAVTVFVVAYVLITVDRVQQDAGSACRRGDRGLSCR